MDKLVKYIACGLVTKPELVQVTTREEDDCCVIELNVGPDDIGKVIGKQGRIAKAIRTIVKASSVNSDKKYLVEIR